MTEQNITNITIFIYLLKSLHSVLMDVFRLDVCMIKYVLKSLLPHELRLH